MGAWDMKYMGSKRLMLQNGLGTLILEHGPKAERIVDLFCGSGAVAWFAAENTDRPVLAVDLQSYAVKLAEAVVGRTAPLAAEDLRRVWIEQVKELRARSKRWEQSQELEGKGAGVCGLVKKARKLCIERSAIGPVWSAYGGHYFSPSQALTIDYMVRYLPERASERAVCLAAVISAASRCAAAPGHTAQPFQPTDTAGEFLLDAWKRDPLEAATKALNEICAKHAQSQGAATVSDALTVAGTLNPGDLVIVDPPYSGVQYSRFYHVLETIARGKCGDPTGRGRYPPIDERPQSDFCNKTTSLTALDKLLGSLAKAGASVILTFPEGMCTNGLSGKLIVEQARALFKIEQRLVSGKFSTLGGNNSVRKSRKPSRELLLVMRPLS